jgi:outer membrane immunogenic protein
MSRMRNLLLASVGAAVCSSAAIAADLPTTKGPPPAPAPAVVPYSWTGLNIGVQAGYGWGVEHDDLSTSSLTLPGDSFALKGAIGGAHLGYDQQFGSLVLGVLGELDASGLAGSKSMTSTVYNVPPNCNEGCTITNASLAFRNTWQAFLLARAGIAFDRLLVYAVGGLAVGDDRESITATQRIFGCQCGTPQNVWTGKQTDTLYGGAVGVGAEYAFDEHWRLGAEWRYANFGKGDYSVSRDATAVSYKAAFSENLAVVDLSYRF